METDYSIKPEDNFDWSIRNVSIKSKTGRIIYHGEGLEFPRSWSDMSAKVVGSKYFFVGNDPEKPVETSVKQLVHRVAHSISEQAAKQGIVEKEKADKFYRV